MLLYYLIYKTRCEKEIKCKARLIYSIKHEHSCKILYVVICARNLSEAEAAGYIACYILICMCISRFVRLLRNVYLTASTFVVFMFGIFVGKYLLFLVKSCACMLYTVICTYCTSDLENRRVQKNKLVYKSIHILSGKYFFR